jgi:hypothetical protein
MKKQLGDLLDENPKPKSVRPAAKIDPDLI